MQKPRKSKPKRPRRSWLDQLGGEAQNVDERPRERVHLAPVYFVLGGFVVFLIAVTLIWGDPQNTRGMHRAVVNFIDRFGPNLASESVGILLTVVFVRKFLELHERSRRLRASVGALRKARRSLQDLLDTWAATMKGCMQQRERGQYLRVQEILSPDSSELLLWCDPNARRPGGEHERWVAWAGQHVRAAQNSLDQIVGTYGGTLDPEYVEALDTLIADPFLKGFADLTADEHMEAPRWRVALNTVRALRMAHFERLLSTIKLHNQLAAETATVRGRVAAPRTSMLGVELAADHDLRVDTTLDEGWWRSAPNVGSLRLGDFPVKRAAAEAGRGD
jgi:hypothetical protein